MSDVNKRIEEISKLITVVKKANFSRGMDVLRSFIDQILELNPTKIEIIEKHHVNKKDKPSGTAVELQNYIYKKYAGSIDVTSVREGEEMGEHIIVAYVGDEKLTIKHNALSRNIFTLGVVEDVKRLLK